tara:strand:+ start:1491 stop:1730 length:240 start_codon:yes stop_codon:yes gene_type:complete
MAEATEQQGHLQQVLEQQNTLSTEIQQLSSALESKRSMFTKLQGVREYLEQTGVTLPEPPAEEEGVTTVDPEVTPAPAE